MRTKNKKLIMLVTTLAMITAGIFIWNIFFNKTNLSDDTADVQNPAFNDALKGGDNQIDDAKFESEMRNRLTKKELKKDPIPVSDPRLANVQKTFSIIEQPYEPPQKDKDGKILRMSIDSFTGAAKYTNGVIINQDGRVTARPKGASIDDFQVIPLVRTLVQELTDLTNKPYSKENMYEMMKRITELQKYVERINLIDFSSLLIEINTYIDQDQASYDKAVRFIKEFNKLVNLDKA